MIKKVMTAIAVLILCFATSVYGDVVVDGKEVVGSFDTGGDYTPTGTWDWSTATVTWPTNLATYNGITPSADIQALLGSTDYATARTNMGLAIGTNVPAWNADIDTLAAGGTANCLWGEKSDSSGLECKSTINIQMDDSAAQFKDATDATKTFQIELGSIATGTKRTMTIPNADFTPAGLSLDNTFTGANTIGDGGDDQRIVSRINSTNERWSGHTIYFAQCAASLAFGTPVYIQSTGKPAGADADAAATMPAIGLIVVASTDADTPCTVLTHGLITDTDWNWTPGATLYVSETVGSVENTLSNISDTNDVVQVVGIAVHADSIFVNPSLTTVVLE